MARKDPGHSAKSAGGRLQLNMHHCMACTLCLDTLCMKGGNMVHGCMVYTKHAMMAAVSHGTSHITTEQHCDGVRTLLQYLGGYILHKACYKKMTH